MKSAEQISAEAAGWLDRMNRAAFDSAEGAKFDAWMDADARHREAFAEMAAIWQADTLATACENAREAPATQNRRTFPVRWLSMAASVAVVIVLAILLAPAIPRQYVSAPGDIETIALGDGSRITLGGNSAVSVQYWPWSRQVTLERGEAEFDVARSRWRTFAVDAGSVSVRVLGTAFHVDRLSQSRVGVGVLRGHVRLIQAGGSLDLHAGEAGLATAQSLTRASLQEEQSQSGSGWFVMRDAPLGDLIEKLRRHTRMAITLDHPSLGERHLTGRFQIADPEATLAVLERAYGLSIKKHENGISIAK